MQVLAPSRSVLRHTCGTLSSAYVLKVNPNYIRHKTIQYLQLILIHGFCIWDCASISLSPRHLSDLFLDLHRVEGELSCPMHTFPAELKWGDSSSLFQLSFCKQVLFFVVHWVSRFLHFLLVISLFKKAPTISDEILSSVPNHKAVIPLRGKYVVR